jgi:methyl-accepting chemotaxis protein
MKALNIKHKIYLTFAGLAGFFFLFVLLLLNQGFQIKQKSTEIQQNWMPSIIAVNAMNTALNDFRIAESLHIISTDADSMDKYEQIQEQIKNNIVNYQSDYEPLISTEKEKLIYQRFSKALTNYLLVSSQIISTSKDNDTAKATKALKDSNSSFLALTDDLQKLVDINTQGSIDTAKQGTSIVDRTKVVIVIGSILVIVTMGIAMFMLIMGKPDSEQAFSFETLSSTKKTKIISGFLLIIAFFIIFSVLFYQKLGVIEQKTQELNSNWLPSIITVNAISSLTSNYRQTGLLHMLTNDPVELTQIEKDRKYIFDSISVLRKKYEALISSPVERELFKEFNQSYDTYVNAAKQIISFSRNNEKAKALNAFLLNGVLFDDFKVNLNDLVKANKVGGIITSSDVDALFNLLKVYTIGSILFMLALIFIVAMLVVGWVLEKPEIVTTSSVPDRENTKLTIKNKLRMAFLGMSIVFIIYGMVVGNMMENINTQTQDMGSNWMPSIIAVSEISENLNNYRITEAQQLLAANELQSLQAEKLLAQLVKKINKARAHYEPLISSEEERTVYNNFSHRLNDYMADSDKTLNLSRQNQKAEASESLRSNQLAFDILSFNLRKLIEINQAGGLSASDASKDVFSESKQVILVVAVVIFMLAIIFMIIFDKNIAEALTRLTRLIQRLATGNITINNEFDDRKDEIGQMAAAVSSVTHTLLSLTSDTLELIESVQSGILSARAETKNHPGEYGKILSGINQLLNVLTKPLTEVASVMQNLALGDLEGRIEGEYEGELRTLKANVNRSLDTLVNLLSDLGETTKQMANGDLTHFLTGNYQGEFSVLKANTNQTIVQITEILQSIISNTVDSASAITQTTESSKYVAKEASLQMFALQEIVRTIEKSRISVNEITDKATEGNKIACATASLANNGEQQLKNLLELISHVHDEFGKIEHITGQITRIADKTHLLSLNAGLEAMRAGEHGIGFGFVAQQIGKLAEEVSTSAKDVGNVINSSAQSVRLGVKATEESRLAMDEITKAAHASELTVQGISDAIIQQSGIMNSLFDKLNEIQTSSKATASSAEEISATMVTLAQTVRETADQAQRFILVESQ